MELNSRKISKKGDRLHIEFKYDKYIVAVIGTIDGRKFHKKTKKREAFWSVPWTQVIPTVELLKPYGFEFTPAISDGYVERKQQFQKIDRIKSGRFSEKEIDIFKEIDLPFRKYQNIGAGFICVAKGCIIGDEPGLGKTLQSLGATRLKNAKKVLVVCPSSAKVTWEEECKKWVPDEKCIVIEGSPKERAKLWKNKATYYVVSYQLLLRDLHIMKKTEWDFVIADEATDISNPKAKTTKSLKQINARFKVALTGTPINNTVQDLWSIMDWVQPGYLGDYWDFTKEYCIKNQWGSITSYKNLDKLRKKISPFVLRRLKSEVLTELPPKTYENLYIDFSKEERELYDAVHEQIIEELREQGMLKRHNLKSAFVRMTRLKQLTDSMELLTGHNTSSKLNALRELLRIVLSGDDKTIIFTVYREMALILERELAEYNPLIIVGGQSKEDRARIKQMFNEDSVHRVLIMTSAGNRSLNLQRASSVIHYDLPWSISASIQREDRAHRMGQKSNVTVYKTLIKNSIDEDILNILYRKNKISQTVLGDNQERELDIPDLTDEEISRLFRLYK